MLKQEVIERYLNDGEFQFLVHMVCENVLPRVNEGSEVHPDLRDAQDYVDVMERVIGIDTGCISHEPSVVEIHSTLDEKKLENFSLPMCESNIPLDWVDEEQDAFYGRWKEEIFSEESESSFPKTLTEVLEGGCESCE